jgi:hypothetical protein
MHTIFITSPPSFKTKVFGTNMQITYGLISEVTRIQVTNGRAFPNDVDGDYPSKAESKW